MESVDVNWKHKVVVWFDYWVELQNADPLSESRSSDVYVPRDESFSEVKNMTFSFKTVYSVLHAVIPSIETTMIDKDLGFPYFTAIESLFNEGVNLPPLDNKGFLGNVLPRLLKAMEDAQNNILLFETPAMIESNYNSPSSLSLYLSLIDTKILRLLICRR